MIWKRAWVILYALSILASSIRIECLAHVTVPFFALSLVGLMLFRLRCDKLSDRVVAIAVLVGASVSIGAVTIRFQMWTLFIPTHYDFCWLVRILRRGVVVLGTRVSFLAIALTK